MEIATQKLANQEGQTADSYTKRHGQDVQRDRDNDNQTGDQRVEHEPRPNTKDNRTRRTAQRRRMTKSPTYVRLLASQPYGSKCFLSIGEHQGKRPPNNQSRNHRPNPEGNVASLTSTALTSVISKGRQADVRSGELQRYQITRSKRDGDTRVEQC